MSISLRNFRGFRDASIGLERGALLIGANDVGKSTILEAIRFLLTDENPGDQRWRYEEVASEWRRGAKDVGPVVVTAELNDPDEIDRDGLGPLISDGPLVIGRYLLSAKGSAPQGWEAPGDLHVVLPASGMPEGWQMPTFLSIIPQDGGPARIEESEAAEEHGESIWVNVDRAVELSAAVRRAVPTCVHFPPPDEPPASIVDVLEPMLAAELGRRMESAGFGIEQLGAEAVGINVTVGRRLGDVLPRYLPDTEAVVAEVDPDRWYPEAEEALKRAAFATMSVYLDRSRQAMSDLGRPAQPLGPRLGSGARRLAALACLELYLDPELWDADRSIVLTIEEPEASLHPEAQRRVARLLRRLPSANVQTVVVTHSPVFINAAAPTAVRLVRPTLVDGVRLQEVVIPHENLDEIAVELGLSRAELVQTSLLVMVEGPSDVAIIETWCRAAGIDPGYGGVRFVPCRGVDEAKSVALIARRVAKTVNPAAQLLLVVDADKREEHQRSLLQAEAGERLDVFVWREAQIEPYLAVPAVNRWLVASGATPSASMTDEVAALAARHDRKEALRDLTRHLLGREYDVVDDGRRIARFMEPSEFDPEVVDLLSIIRSAVQADAEPDD